MELSLNYSLPHQCIPRNRKTVPNPGTTGFPFIQFITIANLKTYFIIPQG